MQTNSHLSVLIHDQARKYGNRSVLTFRPFGSLQWKTVTWNQFSLRVKQVSNAMLNLNIKPVLSMEIISENVDAAKLSKNNLAGNFIACKQPRNTKIPSSA